ncbi:MAG: hypothetical protein AAF652_05805 [Cyanobacteria bacterium P01_C01_bin.72]
MRIRQRKQSNSHRAIQPQVDSSSWDTTVAAQPASSLSSQEQIRTGKNFGDISVFSTQESAQDPTLQPKPLLASSAAGNNISHNSVLATIQRSPVDVWNRYENNRITEVNNKTAKKILKDDFYSNWFLAQDYLLDPQKWRRVRSDIVNVEPAREPMKMLMEKLLHLRQTETENLLRDIRDRELPKDSNFNGVARDKLLSWSAAGSETLTSDIDVNLKGKGSIKAVGLFNKFFKQKLKWSFDPGTVYDVNVYAQDFMTPNDEGKTFTHDKDQVQQNNGTVTMNPVEEVEQLRNRDRSEFRAFDAYALNQDVWSLVKMRLYMKEPEWNTYKESILTDGMQSDASSSAFGQFAQLSAQFEDAEEFVREYHQKIHDQIKQINRSQDKVYQKMREALQKGRKYLSNHQKTATKKMMAANLLYEAELETVALLRTELAELTDSADATDNQIRKVGLKLKNALSQASLYANEAYLTQGGVHFVVIGQQIGGSFQSKNPEIQQIDLDIAPEELLHAVREQVGDALKVIKEYHHAPVWKAAYKAGKYIDRLAKAAVQLTGNNYLPVNYNLVQRIGEVAVQLKQSKATETTVEDRLSHETNQIGDIQALRSLLIRLGESCEVYFRAEQRQQVRDASAPVDDHADNDVAVVNNPQQQQDPELQNIQAPLNDANAEMQNLALAVEEVASS